MVDARKDTANSSSGGEGRAEGRGSFRTKEYGHLMERYHAMSQMYSGEIAVLDEIIRSDKGIEPSYLESLVKQKAALNRAERMLSLHLATAIQNEKNQEQQLQLTRQRERIDEIREEKKEKEKDLERKAEALNKRDVLAELFLPGKWLELNEEDKRYDIEKLQQDITKLEKELKTEVSKLSDKRKELGITSDKDLGKAKDLGKTDQKKVVKQSKVEQPEGKRLKGEQLEGKQSKGKQSKGKRLKGEQSEERQLKGENKEGKKLSDSEVVAEKISNKLFKNTENVETASPSLGTPNTPYVEGVRKEQSTVVPQRIKTENKE